MARIPLPGRDDLDANQRAVYDKVVQGPRGAIVGPLRAAIHNAELADRWQALGELLRYRTSLSARLSELAILLTARHWDSQFEWFAHEPPARKAGLPEAVIAAVREGRRPERMEADEDAVHDYVEELLRLHVVAEGKHRRVRELLGVAGVVELTALIGYYSMVALTLNAHELPLPEGVKPPLPKRVS
jgi:4-carboxymuconolactone decarboxylase